MKKPVLVSSFIAGAVVFPLTVVVFRRRLHGLLEVNCTTTMSKSFAFKQFAEQLLDLGFGIGQRHAALLGDLIHPPIPSTGTLMS